MACDKHGTLSPRCRECDIDELAWKLYELSVGHKVKRTQLQWDRHVEKMRVEIVRSAKEDNICPYAHMGA